MLLRRIAVENVRSFLEHTELAVDGSISILIGPNGGGKTNLLDVIVIMLRRYLFASMYAVHTPIPENPERHEFRENDILNNMSLERHNQAKDKPQVIEIEVEATTRDIENMQAMRNDAVKITELARNKYVNLKFDRAANWKLDGITEGVRFTYKLENGRIAPGDASATEFREYLNLYEMDSLMRDEFDLSPLATPMVYLSVNRTAAGFHAGVQLANYNPFEQKRQNDAAYSRSSTSLVAEAVARMAQKYLDLLHKDKGGARTAFMNTKNMKEFSTILAELGYEWDLRCVDKHKNQYDIELTKQGTSFLVGAASSGERELLTYLFAIFGLNVRDALIIVDEPELHLHPQWQRVLLKLFDRLTSATGNQFVLATHAPAFISPISISYVSRVFSKKQRSHVVKLDTSKLPKAKHLLRIVNSQNNERIFFANHVVLVEGVSDRIFFESVLDMHGRESATSKVIELINVDGKKVFDAYRSVLAAAEIPFSIIADRDYVEDIGTEEIKKLFVLDEGGIKKKLIDDSKSLDGAALVKST